MVEGATRAGEARHLVRRFDFHHTPKRGSWLNAAEAELSVLTKQCLDRRIGDLGRLAQETACSMAQRNRDQVKIQWRFSVHDARRKLSHLYPAQP